jgi:hypothetical protein
MIAAALAGGLVVKMTQGPAPVPVAAVKPAVPPVSQQDAAPEAKPSPVVEPATPAALPVPAVTAPAAPAPVPTKPRTQIARTNPVRLGPPPYEPPAPAAPPAAPEPPQPQPPPVVAAVDPPRPPEPLPQVAPPAPQPDPVPPAQPRKATVPTGTIITVRLDESLSSDRRIPGDTFSASLAEPLVADGLVVAERGARVTGRVTDVRRAGRLSGTSMLQLELSSLTTADGQRVGVYSEPWTKQGEGSGRREAAAIGGGAAIGAIIGAIAGGGSGAAIGAGAGGAAGTGAAAIAGGKAVNVPSETVIRFRLASSVTIREKQF